MNFLNKHRYTFYGLAVLTLLFIWASSSVGVVNQNPYYTGGPYYSCVDGDNGVDEFTASSACSGDNCSEDRCETDARLREATCFQNAVNSVSINCPLGCDAGACRKERPNFLVIISDDHDYELLGFMGHPTIQTPNLDSLANGSVIFTNGTTAMSRCRPVLASLLSGQDPSENNIYYNMGGGSLSPVNALPEILRENGYHNFVGGKFWEGNPTAFGFTDVGAGPSSFVRDGQDDVLSFIDEQSTLNNPFFIWYAPSLPHTPYNASPDILDQIKIEDVVVPSSIAPEDTEQFLTKERAYYANILRLDNSIGEIIGKLQQTNEIDNTIIIFFIDNGQAHGYVAKGSPYEKGFKTPIFFKVNSLGPRVSLKPLSVVDLPSTILDLAGISIPSTYTGTSIKPYLEGYSQETRPYVVEGVYAGSVWYGAISGVNLPDDMYAILVKDERYKYIKYIKAIQELDNLFGLVISHEYVPFPARDAGTEELYDLFTDPREKVNLVSNPTLQAKLSELRGYAGSFLSRTLTNSDNNNDDEDTTGIAAGVGLLGKKITTTSKCIYGKEYSSAADCSCEGKFPRWSKFESNAISCTPDNKSTYICKDVPTDTEKSAAVIPQEIRLSIRPNIPYTQAKTMIERAGGKIRLQPCNWETKTTFNYILAETIPGFEQSFINSAKKSGLFRDVSRNQQVVCVF